MILASVVLRGEGRFGMFNNPPPPKKIQSYDKSELNYQFFGKSICNNIIRIRVSLICKFSVTPD
jgi:hypothetical protein